MRGAGCASGNMTTAPRSERVRIGQRSNLRKRRVWGWRRMLLCGAPLFCAAVLSAQETTGRGTAEVIRGRVMTDSGQAVAWAVVTVTRAGDFAMFRATSDSTGEYSLIVPDGVGDYLVHISAPGRQALRKRVRREATGMAADSILLFDARLVPVVSHLATVRVEEAIPKPTRSVDPETDPGSAETIPDNFLGMLQPDGAGNVAALAATQAGIVPQGSGYSVLGLGNDQNRTMVNGFSYNGSAIPRDVKVRTRIATSAYDPSRGGFSGALVNIDVEPGGVFSGLSGHGTIDAPALQYTDPVAAKLGQRPAALGASIGGLGPLTYSDHYFYSYGIQAARRTAPITSLIGADASLLRHAGVAADSVRRLLVFLAAAGVPAFSETATAAITSDEVRLLARFDHAPLNARTMEPPRTQSALTMIANWSRMEPVGFSLVATPSHTGEFWQASGQVQGLYSTFVGGDYLWETRTALSLSRQRTVPRASYPDETVLVESGFEGGGTGANLLQFGGNGSLDRDARQWGWETVSELQFYPARRAAHRLKLTGGSRVEGYDSVDGFNRLGTFVFHSLGDLTAGRPLSFSRNLSPVERAGGAWSAFASAGDLWRPVQAMQVLYGARLESEGFTTSAATDPAIVSSFAARNGGMSTHVHLSPRMGFTWVLAGGGNSGATLFNRIGQFNLGPTRFIRGGVGEFRNALAPDLFAGGSTPHGLPSSALTVTCFGPAAPNPQWERYAQNLGDVPRSCIGDAAPLFSGAVPNVDLLSSDFKPSRSWRANLSYSALWKMLAYSVEGIYSDNLDQPGYVDLNLRSTPAFTLSDEGRPVLAPSSAIVPTTGVVSPVATRQDPRYGRVLSRRSDLRSLSRQLNVTVAPDLFRTDDWYASLAYTLSDVRSLSSGFDGSTFSAPSSRDWARGDLTSRHQFLLRAGLATEAATISLFGRVQSGVPFTPLVNADVNGDGLANDRAFVFPPTSSGALGSAMNALLNTSRLARACLGPQAGHAAARNSCEGPWTASLNAQITFNGGTLGIPRRIRSIALGFVNPLGGLDQLLHGSAGLRGWGTLAKPDPILYYVRGFDAQSARFRYDVNPRFGDANPANTTLREPFRVSIDVSLSLGRDFRLQQIEKALKPGRRGYPGPRLTVTELAQRYAVNVPSPYGDILRDPDALLLSRSQIESLQSAQTRWLVRRDSLLTALASFLASLPEEYSAEAALARQEQTIAVGWEMARVEAQERLPNVLSAAQLRLAPGDAGALLRAKRGEGPQGRTLRG
jgi:hypothetical protein